MPNGTKRYTLVIPDDLHARCVEAAKADHRPLSSWMLLRLIEAVSPFRLNYKPYPSHEIRKVSEHPTREEKLHS